MEKKIITVKGSYFPGEEYDFEGSQDKLVLFVEMLKSRGCYISDDGHIRSKKGGLMSKVTRNGVIGNFESTKTGNVKSTRLAKKITS